jgi:hypothetical protein
MGSPFAQRRLPNRARVLARRKAAFASAP